MSTLSKIFQGVAENMLTDFSKIQGQIHHAGERGTQREETLKKFLEAYLPKKYGVGTGQVINNKDEVSKQCDIVIYDALNCPLLLIKPNYQLFPIEAVRAVIEVKSTLNANTLRDCVDNIEAFKRLYPPVGQPQDYTYPGYFIFSYSTDYQKANPVDAIARRLVSLIKKRRFGYPELVCALDSGIAYGDYKGLFSINNNDAAKNLLDFYGFLLLLLPSNQGINPFMGGYFGSLSEVEIKQFLVDPD